MKLRMRKTRLIMAFCLLTVVSIGKRIWLKWVLGEWEKANDEMEYRKEVKFVALFAALWES
jgi:hypothetical protein